MGRVPIDIEELLRKAYREAKVDRACAALARQFLPSAPNGFGGGSNAGMIARHMALGTFVDTSAPGARMIADVRAAEGVETDLYDVHDAVLTLPDFYADLRGDRFRVLWDRETARRAGAEIVTPGDGTAPLWCDATNPDDRSIATPLLAISTAVVVILHGRGGDRPVVDAQQQAGRRPIYGGKRKVIGYEPLLTPTDYEQACQRATYAAWRAGLGLLVEALAGLSGYRVTGPNAPADPPLTG